LIEVGERAIIVEQATPGNGIAEGGTVTGEITCKIANHSSRAASSISPGSISVSEILMHDIPPISLETLALSFSEGFSRNKAIDCEPPQPWQAVATTTQKFWFDSLI
jgi:hypothetical protein